MTELGEGKIVFPEDVSEEFRETVKNVIQESEEVRVRDGEHESLIRNQNLLLNKVREK